MLRPVWSCQAPTERVCVSVLIVLMMVPTMGNYGEVEYYHAAR